MKTATAKVFIQALQSLPKEEQREVYEWIQSHKQVFTLTNDDSQAWESLSNESLKEVWDLPENDVWDELFENQKRNGQL